MFQRGSDGDDCEDDDDDDGDPGGQSFCSFPLSPYTFHRRSLLHLLLAEQLYARGSANGWSPEEEKSSA